MLENTENKPKDPTTILRYLVSPPVVAGLLSLTDEVIAAQFATVSETYGVSESYIRANWRQIARRISVATSQRSGQRKETKD